jgi:3-oxoacyl-[acyl-carrier protein] reductase
MKILEGKTALVTGASRGIGKAIAVKLAEHGANVAFTDLSINEAALETEAQINALGVKGKAYASDASSFQGSQETVDKIVEDFGKIDILVNNAGITKDGLLMRMTEDQWDAVININLKSAFNLTKAVQKTMMASKYGSIINISSVVGVGGNAGQANYAASKAGMIGLTKSIAKELGSRNIRCNAVAPGFIVTEMTVGKLSEKVIEAWHDKIPMKRGGTPDEVADTVLFLASDMSSYITGQVIPICGGLQI